MRDALPAHGFLLLFAAMSTMRVRSATFLLGLVLLAAAAATSGMLVLERLAGFHLPGCGMGSPCAQAAASAWGRVPGVGWPVSYVGLAYFLSMLAAWWISRGALASDPRARILVHAGAVASLVFVVVMFVQQHLCAYCLATHAVNIAFWVVATRSRPQRAGAASRASGRAASASPATARSSSPLAQPLAVFSGVFALATIALALADVQQKRDAAHEAERSLAESTDRIIAHEAERSRDATGASDGAGSTSPESPVDAAPRDSLDADAGADRDAGTGTGVSPAPDATSGAQKPIETKPPDPAPPSPPPASRGFTGRYRIGPDTVPMRIVIISDYQCEDCKRVEGEMKAVLASRTDVSLSAKHFPMCSDCNRHARASNFNPHPNACWAARAAESAGILRGNDGFWKMHEWLFSRGGSFTDAELTAHLREEGFDPTKFEALMTSDETLRLVEADIEEAMALGLQFTPMVFVNGIELEGTRTPGGLARAINNVAATRPVARTAANDMPPNATEKIVNDWRKQSARALPADAPEWSVGPAGGTIAITVWGDYQEPRTAEADSLLRAVAREFEGARYTFRHYPINQECNDVATRTLHDQACLAAKAAEAAGSLGGADAYWKMHDWLLRHQGGVSEAAIRGAAPSLGLDPAGLIAAMASPEAAEAISSDARAGKAIGLVGVPTVFVNGKQMRLWREDGAEIVHKILQAASS